MTANLRRAVAPGLGVKGNLRNRPRRERRSGVQGSPRPVLSFSRRNERAYDWGQPLPRPRWYDALLCAAFIVGWVSAVAIVAHYGLERVGR